MGKQMGHQALFISSWACSTSNQLGEGVQPVHNWVLTEPPHTWAFIFFQCEKSHNKFLDPVPIFYNSYTNS